MLGTAAARLEEELQLLNLEDQRLHVQPLETKRVSSKRWESGGILQEAD